MVKLTSPTRAAGKTGLTGFLGVAVAACSAAAGSPAHPVASPTSATATSATATSAAAGPLAIIGDWRSAGSKDVLAGVRLRFADNEVRVSVQCGLVAGHWDAAASGEIVVRIDSYAQECSRTGTTQPSWVATVRRYSVRAGQLVLAADGGATIGVFDRRPWTGIASGSFLGPGPAPTVDAFARQYLYPAPLPSGADPVTGATLVGTWRPTHDEAPAPTDVLRILPTGRWTGWDGCRPIAGGWVVAAQGQLLQTSFSVPLDNCGPPSTASLTGAARAGLDHGELILTDSGGTVIGRFTRR